MSSSSAKREPRIIAVDFDGTCVTHAFPKVGGNIGAAEVLRDLVAAGDRLILYTMRSDRTLNDAARWFADNGIALYGINCNPLQLAWTSSPKPYAHVYIDDSALGAPLLRPEVERPYIDWARVRRLLLPETVAIEVIAPADSIGETMAALNAIKTEAVAK